MVDAMITMAVITSLDHKLVTVVMVQVMITSVMVISADGNKM